MYASWLSDYIIPELGMSSSANYWNAESLTGMLYQ